MVVKNSSSDITIELDNNLGRRTAVTGTSLASHDSSIVFPNQHKFEPDGPLGKSPNAVDRYQEEPPTTPNAVMGTVYRCEWCPRKRNEATICALPQRFGGILWPVWWR